MQRPCVFVAMLIALAACSGNQRAQTEAAPSTTTVVATPTTAAATSSTTVPASTLMPPPFKLRAAAETREEEWRSIPGSAARECVDVELFQHLARKVGPNARDMALELRSGEWLAGNFYSLKQQAAVPSADTSRAPTYQLKIYWIGLAREPQTPTITARSLSDPSIPLVRGTSGTAFNAGGTFTASGIDLPAQGRWRITGSSTDQWGCYDVEI
ncbi:MAG: hypothetical protein ABI658_29365 [Acidimicrobiales bacterium]